MENIQYLEGNFWITCLSNYKYGSNTAICYFKRLVGGHETLNTMEKVATDDHDKPKVWILLLQV